MTKKQRDDNDRRIQYMTREETNRYGAKENCSPQVAGRPDGWQVNKASWFKDPGLLSDGDTARLTESFQKNIEKYVLINATDTQVGQDIRVWIPTHLGLLGLPVKQMQH